MISKSMENLVKNNSEDFFNNQSSLIESYKIFLGTMMEEYNRIFRNVKNADTQIIKM